MKVKKTYVLALTCILLFSFVFTVPSKAYGRVFKEPQNFREETVADSVYSMDQTVKDYVYSPVREHNGEFEAKIGTTENYLKEFDLLRVDNKKIRNIIYPLLSTPAIVKAGTNLVAKIDTEGGFPDNLVIFLKERDTSPISAKFELPVVQIDKGKSHWHESDSIYDITVDVPKDIPEKLYDIEVSFEIENIPKEDLQNNAVKVVNNFNRDFNFVHITDLHIGSIRNIKDPSYVREAGYWHPDRAKRWLYLQKAIREINLLKPDFVIVSGDIVFGQLHPLEYIAEYEEAHRMLKQFDVPIYLAPGNHDCYAQDGTLTDGEKYWKNYFGPKYYSFDYGEYAHFTSLYSYDWDKLDRSAQGPNCFTWGGQVKSEQLDWIYKDLEENASRSSKRQLRAIFCHHNPAIHDRDIWPEDDPKVQEFWQRYDEEHNPQKISTLILGELLGIKYGQNWHGEGSSDILQLMDQFDINTGFYGHTHIDDVFKKDGILHVTTASTEIPGKPWAGFRLVTAKNGKITSYPSIPIYRDGHISSGVMSLEAHYATENDGHSELQLVSIHNRLGRNVTARIPVYMKDINKRYKISNGSIIQNHTYDDMQYIEVEVKIPAGTTIDVAIAEKEGLFDKIKELIGGKKPTEPEIHQNDYPIILVHGFAGWGRDEIKGFFYWGGRHDIETQLIDEGYRVYTAAVGPFSSNWDRACELYAFIKGGTVDYGEKHSQKYGHERFGRTYKGIYPEWGEINPETGKVNKIHIVGHSMGSQTIRTLVQLLEKGHSSEMKSTSDDAISALFEGGKSWVHSVTTISSTHDGTTAAEDSNAIIKLAQDTISLLGTVSGIGDAYIYDFNLDQWGLKRREDETIRRYLNRVMSSSIWDKNNKDTGLWDLTPQGAQELNKWVKTQPNIYYFSWSTKASKPTYLTGYEIPDRSVMNPAFYPNSLFMGSYTRNTEPIIDKEWWPNDGCVNLISQNAPKLGVKNPKIKNWKHVPRFDEVKKGVWHHMPILDSVDHSASVGIALRNKHNNIDVKKFYSELCANLSSIAGDDPIKQPKKRGGILRP